jgi:hypothetical protein
MHIYRFRILLEENDQFFREIDVKANQTFEDFHNTLVATAGFDNKEMASFYICDSKWNKQEEICLCDMVLSEEEDNPSFEEEDDEDAKVTSKKQRIPIKCMSDTRLKDMIIDPHQRMIYVYDFLRMYTFYIELYKVLSAENGKQYPHVGKSVGKIIHAPSAAAIGEIDDEEEEGITANLTDDLGIANDLAAEDQLFEGFYDDSYNN